MIETVYILESQRFIPELGDYDPFGWKSCGFGPYLGAYRTLEAAMKDYDRFYANHPYKDNGRHPKYRVVMQTRQVITGDHHEDQ